MGMFKGNDGYANGKPVKRSPQEIARAVAAKAEEWERLERASRQQRGMTPPAPPPTDDELNLSELAAQADTITIARADLYDLLLAGFALTDSALEERPEKGAAPRWCTACGKRGEDMRRADLHLLSCAVGLWLHTVETLEKVAGDRGGVLAAMAERSAAGVRMAEEWAAGQAAAQEERDRRGREAAERWERATGDDDAGEVTGGAI